MHAFFAYLIAYARRWQALLSASNLEHLIGVFKQCLPLQEDFYVSVDKSALLLPSQQAERLMGPSFYCLSILPMETTKNPFIYEPQKSQHLPGTPQRI